MASVATNTSTFPHFSDLALELRDQIWQDALPEKVGPALYFYQRGSWRPRRLSASDEGYDAENDDNNLSLEFCHDLLDDAHFDIPLFSTSYEARRIAQAWIREHGIQIRTHEKEQYPVLARPLDPNRDALYVTPEHWIDFLCEPSDRTFEPDLFGASVHIVSTVTRLAVPEGLLRAEVESLPDVFQYFGRLEVLYVVVGVQPELLSTDDHMKGQQRWELEDAQQGAYVWSYDRSCFEFQAGGRTGDEALYTLIEAANNALREELVKNRVRTFEVRPIFAARSC